MSISSTMESLHVFLQVLQPCSLVTTLITRISHILVYTPLVYLHVGFPHIFIITVLTFMLLGAVVVVLIYVVIKTYFSFSFIITLVTVYVCDVMMCHIMRL